MSHKLAIDFGTTNTVIAHWNPATNAPETVTIPNISTQNSLIPSLLYVNEGRSKQVTVGQAVRQNGLDQQRDNRLFRNFKRGVVTSTTADPREIDGAYWGDRDAGQSFIRSLIAGMPYGKDDIEQLVLTAPVASFEGYLSWLNEAMTELSDRIYIVDESTAAALGYAVTEPGAAVLVFDFGGGTLDLSLVQLPESREKTGGALDFLRKRSTGGRTAKVIAKGGRVLGGSDIDQWLLTEVLNSLNLTPSDLGKNYAALLTACEKAKIELSTVEETVISFDAAGQTNQVEITREGLEFVLETNGFYNAIRHIIDKTMHVAHRSGIFKEDINAVLLVGGVSLMPSVQRTLKEYFTEASIHGDKPFTAVAEGALQVAAGYGLDDYLMHSYGIRHLDPQTGETRYDEIVPEGSRYPSEKPVEVILSAAHANQGTVEFVIGEIGGDSAAMVEVQYEDGQTVFVAQANSSQQEVIPLNESQAYKSLAYLKPAGNPGEDRLKARFSVDDQRRLRLTVSDLKTHKELLRDVVIATLVNASPLKDVQQPTDETRSLNGREPQLADATLVQGQRRLSLRSLAKKLNRMPAGSISVDAAAAALASKSPTVRFSAAQALARRGDREARLALQNVLATGDAPARASAARHLYGFTWFTAEPLLRQALTDSDSRVHESVMYALADFRDQNAYSLMTESLQNAPDNVREAAAYGLRDCQHPAAVPVLALALLARDPDVRTKALEALSATKAPQAIPVVRTALSDPDSEVVYAATLSLLELARADCLDELAVLLQGKRGLLRERLLRAIFHATNYLNMTLGDHDSMIDALAASLTDEHPAARMAAVWPLAWSRSERASELLKDAYHAEPNWQVKGHIVRVSASLMSLPSEEILQHALTSEITPAREAAQKIMAERERTGIVLTYDSVSGMGKGLQTPTLGR